MKSDKRILITGGAGFIGSHIAEELAHRGWRPLIIDNLKSGQRKNLNGIAHTFIEGDVRNFTQISEAMRGCQAVFHLAALTSVAESMERPDDYIDVNLRGTLNVLKAARENGVEKVVFASSASIYGDSAVPGNDEEMRPEPKSPYAITKLDGEYYCSVYQEAFSLPTVCARFFNVFGERQDPVSPYAAAVPIFISRALRNDVIKVYGDGTQTRDFVYVRDIANAMIFLMERAVGVFNIGYGKSIRINRLVEMVKSFIKSDSRIVYAPERQGEIKHSRASVKKLSQLDFRPVYSLESGLQKTMQWFSENNAHDNCSR